LLFHEEKDSLPRRGVWSRYEELVQLVEDPNAPAQTLDLGGKLPGRE
jgi:hypothetical protein